MGDGSFSPTRGTRRAVEDDVQAANDRLATKMIRLEINRILLKWDPLCVKGLPRGDREYEPFVGELSIMVKKGAGEMEIARHLAALVTQTWKLPKCNEKCVEVAKKLYNAGALFRGEKS